MSCFPGRSEFPHHTCASYLLHHNWLQKPQNLLLCENTNSCLHVYNSDLRWARQGNLQMIVKTASKCQTLHVHHSVYWGSIHFCVEVHWWHITVCDISRLFRCIFCKSTCFNNFNNFAWGVRMSHENKTSWDKLLTCVDHAGFKHTTRWAIKMII